MLEAALVLLVIAVVSSFALDALGRAVQLIRAIGRDHRGSVAG